MTTTDPDLNNAGRTASLPGQAPDLPFRQKPLPGLILGVLAPVAAILLAWLWLQRDRGGLVVACTHDAEFAALVFDAFTRSTGIPVTPMYDTEATKSLVDMREREGRTLVDDLRQQGELIADRLKQIAHRAPVVIADYEQRLRQRIEAMLKEAQVKVDAVDLIREIAVYAERTDIAEEISRLGGHLEQFADLLRPDSDKPVGRTLDFLAQEMLREANTIASKSPDAGISKLIVEVKGAIDRIKEQAANVE